MRLPAGFEHRAENIARLAGRAMALLPHGQSRFVDRLEIGPVRISPHSSDQEIAACIVESIRLRLAGNP